MWMDGRTKVRSFERNFDAFDFVVGYWYVVIKLRFL